MTRNAERSSAYDSASCGERRSRRAVNVESICIACVAKPIGSLESPNGAKYEVTFNTWGYAWPKSWGACPNKESDPQLFGKNAYAGLFHFDAVKRYVAELGSQTVNALFMAVPTPIP